MMRNCHFLCSQKNVQNLFFALKLKTIFKTNLLAQPKQWMFLRKLHIVRIEWPFNHLFPQGCDTEHWHGKVLKYFNFNYNAKFERKGTGYQSNATFTIFFSFQVYSTGRSVRSITVFFFIKKNTHTHTIRTPYAKAFEWLKCQPFRAAVCICHVVGDIIVGVCFCICT